MGLSSGVAQGKVAEYESRHPAVFDDVLGRTHDDGRNIVCLQITRGQTHGLMTDGSVGYQDRDVHLILSQKTQQIGAVLFDGGSLAAICRSAVVARGYLADTLFVRGLA